MLRRVAMEPISVIDNIAYTGKPSQLKIVIITKGLKPLSVSIESFHHRLIAVIPGETLVAPIAAQYHLYIFSCHAGYIKSRYR